MSRPQHLRPLTDTERAARRHHAAVHIGDLAHDLGEMLVTVLAILFAVAAIASISSAAAMAPVDLAFGWRALLGLGVAAILTALTVWGLNALTAPRPSRKDEDQ